jgi:antitoxin VapB
LVIYIVDIDQQEDGMRRARAKLFYNGRSQAVRLPKEFRLPGDEVMVQWEGRSLILTPLAKTLGEVIDELARRPGVDDSFVESVRELRKQDRSTKPRDVTS